MRKITETVCKAFVDGKAKCVGNTSTDGGALFLHGNRIAEKRDDGVYATLAGWGSVTTRERLNGLCELLGVCEKGANPFYQKQGKQYFWNLPISDSSWVRLPVDC